MKKSALFSLAAFCALPFLFSFRQPVQPPTHQDGIMVKVKPMVAKKSFVLRLYNLQKKPTRVMIHDRQGHRLMSEKIMYHNGYRKLINLQQLNKGEYIFTILHPEESKTGTIKVGFNRLEIDFDESGE